MAPRPARLIPVLLPGLALVTACAPDTSFPSLAPRPGERLSTDEPVRQPVFVAPDPALSTEIAELIGAARRGQSEFEAALPAARANVARAGAAGSDSWVEAQQAISRLEAARASTARALADLDRLSIERAARPTNAAQFAELLNALELVQSLAQAQYSDIDRLRGSLRQI